MPRLPFIDVQGGLPSESRTPLVRQPVSARGGRARIPLGTAQPVGRGIAAVGETLASVAEIEARRQRAQDELDSKQEAQEFQLDIQAHFTQLAEEGDFRTLPDAIETAGRERIAAQRQRLNRTAGQRFEIHALDILNNLKAKALGVRFARHEQQKEFVARREMIATAATLGNATDEASRALAQMQFEEFAQRGVEHGMWTAAHANQMLEEVRVTTTETLLNNQIQRNPEAVATQMRARLEQGEQTFLGKPIAEILATAEHVERQRRKDLIDDENRTIVLLEREQDSRAVELQQDISVVDPLPENLPQLRALLGVVNREGEDGLGIRHHDRLSQRLTGLIRAASAPTAGRDDPLQREWFTYQIEVADSTDDLRYIQEQLHETEMKGLTPQTFGALNRRVEARLHSTHYSNLQEYRDGRNWIQSAYFPVQTGGILDISGLPASDRTSLIQALTEYDVVLRGQPAELRNTFIRQHAMEEADRIRKKFLARQLVPGLATQTGLGFPANFQAIETEKDFHLEMARMQKYAPIPETAQLEIFKRWKAFRRLKEEQAAPTPGAR